MTNEIITAALKSAIKESDLNFLQLEQMTGVKRQSLMRFMQGKQSLLLENADRLAKFFEFQIKYTRFGILPNQDGKTKGKLINPCLYHNG